MLDEPRPRHHGRRGRGRGRGRGRRGRAAGSARRIGGGARLAATCPGRSRNPRRGQRESV